MNKKVLYALILIAVCVIVLIFNRQSISVDLIIARVSGIASLVFLVFIGVGVVIGLLLK